MKRCSNCFVQKPFSEFYPNRTARHPSNRLQSYCKQCKRETLNGWRHRKKEKERHARAAVAADYVKKYLKGKRQNAIR